MLKYSILLLSELILVVQDNQNNHFFHEYCPSFRRAEKDIFVNYSNKEAMSAPGFILILFNKLWKINHFNTARP